VSEATSPQAVLDEIAALARGDDLARLVHTVAFAAADERRGTLTDGLAEVFERAGLKPEDAETRFGNVLRALERSETEAAGSASRALLSGLLARGVALSPPVGADAEARVAEALLWLASHTPADALSGIDAALGEKAGGLWVAVAALVRKIDAGSAPLLGRPGALVGAAALCESASDAALAEACLLVDEIHDPVVKSLLGALLGANVAAPKAEVPPEGEEAPPASAGPASAQASGRSGVVVEGEVVAPPRGPAALVLLGITGILAAMHVGRLVARLALRYRRPAELRVTPKGVTVKSHTEVLGRTLREREVVIPIESLLRATREVRYPRLGLYAGLFALAVGSYFGASMLIDGVRAGSPELIGVAALLMAAGVGLDFLLESAGGGMRGKCRVVLVPRGGPALAVGDVDPVQADAALGRLKRA
jgi:hypothetical protein